VTLKFQLECFSFSSKKFYIMDTPGFDMDNERAVFDEIIRGIEAVRPYAKIVGIMLVTRINDSRAEAFDNRLVAFVDKLCGPAYAAQVTVVTNFWNVSEPEEKTEFETRLDESLQRWRAVLGQDLKQYQHGRRYNSFGEDAGECLKWRGNSDDIKVYAKAMVNRHYGGIKLRDPVIIQELSENRSLGKTAAGRFLGIDPSPQSSTSTSASSPSQAEATTPPPTTPEPEAEEIPRPSASSRRANSNQSQSQAHPDSLGGNPFLEVSKWVGKEVIVTVIQQVLTNLSSGVTSGQGGGGFPSHLGKYIALHRYFRQSLSMWSLILTLVQTLFLQETTSLRVACAATVSIERNGAKNAELR
jgi:hypothetical protein